MEKQTIIKLILPIALISSIYSVVIYNILVFTSPKSLETHYSFFLTSSTFTTAATLTFILFLVTLIISIKYLDKITNQQIIIAFSIIVGFCSILAGISWFIEIFFLDFILVGVLIAYLTPAVNKFTSDKINSEYKNDNYLYILPVSIVIWILISWIFFTLYGETIWRFLYIITGIINISATPFFSIM